ncbi:YoaK family protein [uncultured Hymenobacter sp.]|uniref:YoaK family protein n=1 Tax=uncultured Hymenobacter sp. TaxID=170016 RepID=UPI0035CBC8AF
MADFLPPPPGPVLATAPVPAATPGPAAVPPATLRFTLALVALAGYVDAVSYLRYQGLYVSFMSGNTTALGVAIAKQTTSKIGQLAGVLALFVVGALLGNLLARWARQWGRTLILTCVAGLLLLAGAWPAGAIACLTLAMGALNATVHKEGSVTVSLTYVTGTLVHFATGLADLLSGQAPAKDWPGLLTFWLAFLGGALAGAVLLVQQGPLALPIAVGLALVLALVARRVQGTQ